MKAAFDVYLPGLAAQMRLEVPENMDKYQQMWRSFSQAVVYRRPDVMPRRASFASVDHRDRLEDEKSSADESP